ncbi:uncharacterized protein LOC128203182 isoform X2 [Mya arenaria]|uniref:uncharacterized protein LOC128203182 isoform X2 n=1 Tax=Mya arenaria TaxID=6604 RepID=UPI0022E630C9|nr:uncharacterized protein LOC128203182 isoform X2 [Mya arenaria]
MTDKAKQTPLKSIGAQALVELSRKCFHEKLRKKDKFRSLFRVKWSQKFVVVAHACLYIYGDEESKNYDTAFSMAVFKCVNEHKNGDRYFYLTFNDPDWEHIVFCCDSNKSQKKWMKTLKAAIDQASDSGIGHDDEAEQTDDEDSDDETDNISAMTAAKRPDTYMQINDSDVLSTALQVEPRSAVLMPQNHTRKEHRDDMDNHSKLKSTNYRLSSSSISSTDSESAYLIVSGGKESLVPTAGACCTSKCNNDEEPHYEIPDSNLSPSNKTKQVKSVTTRDKPRSAVPLSQHHNPAGSVQPHLSLVQEAGIPLQEEPLYNNCHGSAQPHLPLVQEAGLPLQEEPLYNNCQETESINTIGHVSVRLGNSPTALKKKGKSTKIPVNKHDQPTPKLSTTIRKTLPRSSQSAKLQEDMEARLHKKGSAQQTLPLVQEAGTLTQEEPLYNNCQEHADDQTLTLKMKRAKELVNHNPDDKDENCYEDVLQGRGTHDISTDHLGNDGKHSHGQRQIKRETESTNSIGHVSGRQDNSSTALKKKGKITKIPVNVHGQPTPKLSTTISKTLPRSSQSAKLNEEMKALFHKKGSAQQTLPVVQEAGNLSQEETLYNNCQDLYENLKRPAQKSVKRDTDKTQ